VLDAITYDSYGNILDETNPENGDRFKYTGREYDPILGMYYYRARYYAPGIGCFVSEDPLGFGGGDTNLYRYGANSPTNFTDPSGRFPYSTMRAIAGPPTRAIADGLLFLSPRRRRPRPSESQIGHNLFYYQNAGWVDWHHAERSQPAAVIAKVRGRRESFVGGRAIDPVDPPASWDRSEWFGIEVQMGEAESILGPLKALYMVRKGLGPQEELEVALAIWMDLSIQFETRQNSLPRSWFSSSGFSQEDLPSNIIGFYMAVLGDEYDTRDEMAQLLGDRLPIDEARTLIIQLGGDLGSPENKNYTFSPKDHNARIPRFQGTPLSWPRELSTIQPAPIGINWLRGMVRPELTYYPGP
jgi:RHS repeat-associated protein